MDDRPSEREATLVEFVQKVAAQRRAICKSDHHAATCDGAVHLAEHAAKVLAGLGIEPRYPQDGFDEQGGCLLCGDVSYVVGQVWLQRWAHATCIEKSESAEAQLAEAKAELAEWREKWSDQNDRMIVARADRESAEAALAELVEAARVANQHGTVDTRLRAAADRAEERKP